MKGIIKDFPGVRALNNVNFEAHSGELLTLMGENGAGKPTLMKALSGVWPHPTYEDDIFLDRQFTDSKGKINWSQIFPVTQKLLTDLGMNDIRSTDLVQSITVGKQQMVEIAKALSQSAELLILDEPTSALIDKELKELFRIIRKLKSDGVYMCYISHKMEEIEQIVDRIAVLRDGETIGVVTPIADITLDQMHCTHGGQPVCLGYTSMIWYFSRYLPIAA